MGLADKSIIIHDAYFIDDPLVDKVAESCPVDFVKSVFLDKTTEPRVVDFVKVSLDEPSESRTVDFVKVPLDESAPTIVMINLIKVPLVAAAAATGGVESAQRRIGIVLVGGPEDMSPSQSTQLPENVSATQTGQLALVQFS